MRKLLFLILMMTTFVGAWADDITFTAEAPEVVVNGDQFRLSYTINSQKVKDFRAPTITNFDVLMGPSRSQQSSTQIINGNVTSSSSITFTYILMATKEGEFSIPGATIVAEGEKRISNAVKVKVLPPDQTSGSSQGGQQPSRRQRNSGASQPSASDISGKDLFIKAIASIQLKKNLKL